MKQQHGQGPLRQAWVRPRARLQRLRRCRPTSISLYDPRLTPINLIIIKYLTNSMERASPTGVPICNAFAILLRP
jgi:hypothetical protein